MGSPTYTELFNDDWLRGNYLEAFKKASQQCSDDNYHKDTFSNPYEKEVKRVAFIDELAKHRDKLTMSEYAAGIVLVNNKFVLSLISKKWRVKGRNKWYRFKDVDTFVRSCYEKAGSGH